MILFYFIIFFSHYSFSQVFIPFGNWRNINCNYSKTHNTAADFSGAYNNTTWTANGVELSGVSLTGDYTSPVVDVFCGKPADLRPWKQLSWKTNLPFYKELTSTSELSTDYSAINVNLMNNLAGYWKLNGIGSLAVGATVPAVTGSNGTVFNTGLAYATGKLLNGIEFNNSAYVSVPHTASIMPATNITFSAWVRATSLAGGGGYPSVLVKTATGSWVDGYGAYYTPGAGFCVYVNHWSARRVCIPDATASPALLARFVHIAMTYNGTNLTIYWDGVPTTIAAAFTNILSNTSPLWIGNANGGGYAWNGIIDDVAIWNRALSASDILQIYRRGANRVEYQVRSCLQADCSDNPTWKGPNGSNATFFSELNNNTVQDGSTGNVLTAYPNMIFSNFLTLLMPSNRYFQYKIFLNRDNTTTSPSVKEVQFDRN